MRLTLRSSNQNVRSLGTFRLWSDLENMTILGAHVGENNG